MRRDVLKLTVLREPPGTAWRFRSMAIEFYFTPELHLKDGRIIRDLDDATTPSKAGASVPESASYL